MNVNDLFGKDLDAAAKRLWERRKRVNESVVHENAEGLNVGDPVIITGKGIEFEGKTGDIVGFGRDNRFVVVNLYNHGKHSFHSSDVSYNDYADSDEEEARMYDAGEFRDELNEYLVKGGMPVKDVLSLNLFTDLDPDEGCSAVYDNFAQSPEWRQVERKYAPIARTLEKQILSLNRPMTQAEAEEVEEVWYDGSDAYDDMEIGYLVEFYKRQIAVVEAVIAGELQDNEELDESEDSPVANAITRRIMNQHLDLLSKYGPGSVLAAIDDVSEWVGDVDEIGSSDVSGWVKQVTRMLEENPPEAFGVGELDEAPIEMDPANPMNPMIYGHNKANPANLEYRMLRAQGQLKDLAARATNASPAEWQTISKHFEELKMNIEQIKHALEELAKERRKGGVRSRGIDKNIDEDVAEYSPTGYWDVYLWGNWYRGKWHDFSPRKVAIPGASEEEAREWIEQNADKLYAKYNKLKGHNGRLLLRRPAEKNLFLDKTKFIGPSTAYKVPPKEQDIAEGMTKHAMHDAAERMELAQFLDRFAHSEDDIEWMTEFWKTATGEEGVAEGSKDSAPKMSKQERKLAQGALKGAKDMSATLGLVRDKDGVLRMPKNKEQGVAEGSVTKKPQPYNDPNWTKNLSKKQMDALAGTRHKKDKKDTQATDKEIVAHLKEMREAGYGI